jgi:SnoaL-like domain/Activator of Hsp90 ATPase homolog 1-like protein
VIHGPDGTEHVVRSVFREVVPFKRIAYDVHDRVSGLKFAVTVSFQSKGPKTIIDWYSVFETAEELIKMVKTHGADEGLRQTLDSLEQYLMEKVIKEYFSGYEKKDWNLIERLLADGFTFTSPNDDDHIDIKAFKEKCWPQASTKIKRFDVDKVIGNGDEAFARYQVMFTDGASTRNTEYFKFENGKIKEIEVFFGPGRGVID